MQCIGKDFESCGRSTVTGLVIMAFRHWALRANELAEQFNVSVNADLARAPVIIAGASEIW